MYCVKCGHPNKEGVKYCAKCGTPMAQTIPSSPQVTYVEQPKKKSKFIPILIGLFLLSLLGGFGIKYFFLDNDSKKKEVVVEKEEPVSTSEAITPTETPTNESEEIQTLEVNTKKYSDEEIKTLLYKNTASFYRTYIEALNIHDISIIKNVKGELEEEINTKLKDFKQEVYLIIDKMWIDDNSIIIKNNGDIYTVEYDYGADLSYERNGTKYSHPKFHAIMEINPNNNDWALVRSETDRKIETGNHTLVDITNY